MKPGSTSCEAAAAPLQSLTDLSATEQNQTTAGVEGRPATVRSHTRQQTIQLSGEALAYTITTGWLPIRNAAGEIEANLFFIAYTCEQKSRQIERPLLFAFSGGPGLASVLLHLGALGPKRVNLMEDGRAPAPPYQILDNEMTLLDQADLVFVDPVGTGYSHAAPSGSEKKYWGMQQDIGAIGEFIRVYLNQYSRWFSPRYLLGTSYGAARAAGLSDHLLGRGIGLSGLVLVSPALDWQTGALRRGHDLPYVLMLPTYTATAWHHRKLPADLLQDLHAAINEAETWAATEYAVALLKGDCLTTEERRRVIGELACYTGLSERYLDQSNLRVDADHFCKELLRDENRSIARLDSRFKTIDARAVSETPDFDPCRLPTGPLLTAAIHHYLAEELGVAEDAEYRVFNKEAHDSWDWGAGPGYPDAGEALRNAITKNPHLRVLVASGYYDLTTPYYEVQYTLKHLGLDPTLRTNIKTEMYESGHALYLDQASLSKFKADLSGFIRGAGLSSDAGSTARRSNL